MHTLAIITESTGIDIGLALAIIGAIVGGAIHLARKETQSQVSAARLATAVESLAAQVGKVADAVEHLDGRVDEHDTEIALLKQRQEAA